MPQEDLIKKLAYTITDWHKARLETIDKILEAPSVAEIVLGEGENPTKLTGDRAVGFRMGLIVCRDWIENLPFKFGPTDGPCREAEEGEVLKELEVQTVYVFTSDDGDGSSSVQYTRDPDLLERLQEEDDEFNMNEGYSDVLTFPATIDLEACGFSFYQE